MSKTRKRNYEEVVFAADLPGCPMCDEPWCEKHRQHFTDCPCIGPTEDGVAYTDINGVMYGRRIRRPK